MARRYWIGKLVGVCECFVGALTPMACIKQKIFVTPRPLLQADCRIATVASESNKRVTRIRLE
jgi:hypothetical protein